MENLSKIGVGVMVLKDGKILLGQRLSSHGSGEYSTPGGHLEYMETFESCARRETREECGIEITNLRLLCLANVTVYQPKHYIHVGLIADWQSGDVKTMEPEKCAGWGWYALDELPSPIFRLSQLGIDAWKHTQSYFPEV